MERAEDDPNMFVITYEGEHRHGLHILASLSDGDDREIYGSFCAENENQRLHLMMELCYNRF